MDVNKQEGPSGLKEFVTKGLNQFDLTIPGSAADQLLHYSELLLEQNKVMNLTAITEPYDVAALHFLDSAALLHFLEFRNKRVIDVGTGAGFPGLALKIIEPSISLTLLDSLGKRIDWLASVCRGLQTENVECLHARAEEQALLDGYRDSYDLAVSRAVAPLRLLTELCLPYVRVGGSFLAMKSTDSEEELSMAASAIQLLGGRLSALHDYQIPGTGIVHRIVVMEKVRATPKGYPRRWAKMQKSPL